MLLLNLRVKKKQNLHLLILDINPNINTPNQYVKTYKIPWSEWNKTAGVTNTVTQDMMDGWEQYKTTD